MLNKKHFRILIKIVNAIVITTMALLFLTSCQVEKKQLIIYNGNNDMISFPITENDHFSFEFIHSVNKSPVIEYYKIDKNGSIFVYKTIYYNYGAGVPTNITGNEVMSFGNDGSMIIDNINKKIDNLTYYLSNIYDHILKINDGESISMWNTFGKNQIIHIEIR